MSVQQEQFENCNESIIKKKQITRQEILCTTTRKMNLDEEHKNEKTQRYE